MPPLFPSDKDGYFNRLDNKSYVYNGSEYKWNVLSNHTINKPVICDSGVGGDNDDNTIVDDSKNLMWQKSGSPDALNYQNAIGYIEKLNGSKFAGYDNWRIPTLEELSSLQTECIHTENNMYIDPVFSSRQLWCWTSDVYCCEEQLRYFISFDYPSVWYEHPLLENFVRAVRTTK